MSRWHSLATPGRSDDGTRLGTTNVPGSFPQNQSKHRLGLGGRIGYHEPKFIAASAMAPDLVIHRFLRMLSVSRHSWSWALSTAASLRPARCSSSDHGFNDCRAMLPMFQRKEMPVVVRTREHRCEVWGIVDTHPLHWFVIQCGDSQLSVHRRTSEAADSGGPGISVAKLTPRFTSAADLPAKRIVSERDQGSWPSHRRALSLYSTSIQSGDG